MQRLGHGDFNCFAPILFFYRIRFCLLEWNARTGTSQQIETDRSESLLSDGSLTFESFPETRSTVCFFELCSFRNSFPPRRAKWVFIQDGLSVSALLIDEFTSHWKLELMSQIGIRERKAGRNCGNSVHLIILPP